MQVLGLLGMYFDAMVVEVEKYLLFFRLALAILCIRYFVFRRQTAEFFSPKKFVNESKSK